MISAAKQYVRWCEMKTNARRLCATWAQRSWPAICSISNPWSAHNRAGDELTEVQAEYLEIMATRARYVARMASSKPGCWR